MKPIIRVENLSKQYRIGTERASYGTLRDSLTNAVTAPFRRFRSTDHRPPATDHPDTIWALKDINFEVLPGEVVGIIGRNGAGKSTLLKILSRITEPTQGKVDLYGRVGSLLEVGTGFHAELTGRENIYLNGAILGMRRSEIAHKFDEIVNFAGIERFLDTPVKHYSSGMYVKLAFSVAAHLEPEVLIVDEVLAVGDAAFQKKCLSKMDKVAKAGRTVLLVSHHMGTINSLCNRAVLLAEGNVVEVGPAADVIQTYLNQVNSDEAGGSNELRFVADSHLDAQVLAVRLKNKDGKSKRQFDLFEEVFVEVDYVIRKAIGGLVVEAYCIHQGDFLFASFDTDTCQERLDQREPGVYRTSHQIPSPLLGAGHYELLYGIGVINAGSVNHAPQRIQFEVVEEKANTSLMSYNSKTPGKLVVPLYWSTCKL